MDVRLKRGAPAGNPAQTLQDRYRGYVVDPVKVADRMVERAVVRVVPPSLRPRAKFSSR